MKGEKLSFRVSEEEKQTLFKICDNYKITFSQLMRLFIMDSLNMRKKELRINLRKKIEKYFLKIDMYDKIKKQNRDMYILRNIQTSIYKMAQSQLLNNGKMNMVVINKIIRNYEKLYRLFDEDLKKAYKSDMVEISKIKNHDYLYKKLMRLGLVKQAQIER